MKINSKQFIITFLLLITYSLTSISQVFEVDMDKIAEKYHGPFTKRANDPRKVADNIEANLEGAREIGVVYSKSYEGKKLMKKIAKLGGDFYSIDYEKTTVTKTGREKTGSYSTTYGARDDYVQTKVTTTSYSTYDRNLDAYEISIYRIMPEEEHERLLRYGFQDLMEGCTYCKEYHDFGGPRTLERYIAKGFDINSTNVYDVPYFYYFIDCIKRLQNTPQNVGSVERKLVLDYEKLEMLLKAGLNPNFVPTKISDPKYSEKSKVIPYVLLGKVYESPLRIISKSLKLCQGISYFKDNSSGKLYLEFLQKTESLLIEYGAKDFEIKSEN